MGEHLSERDWELIREFAETPAYERSPEILAGSRQADSENDERGPKSRQDD